MVTVKKIQNFGQQLSIHGLNKIIEKTWNPHKIIWLLCFLLSCTFGVRQICITVNTFLLYQTKTKLVSLRYENMSFPAITICPASIYRRSVVGNLDSLYTGAYLSSYGGYDNLSEAYRISRSFCHDPNAPTNLLLNWSLAANNRFFFYDSGNSVMKCEFNGKPLSCKGLFLNKQAEFGWCFTFNIGLELLKSFRIEGEIFLPNVYGTSAKEKRDFQMRSGIRNSITFTMNSNMSEVCIPIDKHIPGFVMYVHDPEADPYLSSKPLVFVGPGFSANIGLSIKKIKRNTEDLGLCQHKIKLKWYPNMTDYTFRDAYILNCMVGLVYDQCKCMPFFAPAQAGVVAQISMQQTVCGSSQETFHETVCVDSVVKEEFTKTHKCHSNIPIPCDETKITSQTIYTVFPSNGVLPSLLRQFNLSSNMTRNEFRQSFSSATFYVKKRKMTYIQVDRKMTWIDLLNQFGGTIGMCLGMSIMSFFELLNLFCKEIWLMNQRFRDDILATRNLQKLIYLY